MDNTRSLHDWLEYIESAHTQVIDMGLERVQKVFKRLSLDFAARCVVTVAGTNGKGTTCRFIEQACLHAEKTVGVYASPHISLFNERIRIGGLDVDDATLCAAFTKIYEAASGLKSHNNDSVETISLSYFEYATLCALLIFAEKNVDVCVLEVGLGGRLDATNIIDANIGVITSIGFDHQSYLGNTLDAIAGEKAGIIKPAQRVVIGYSSMQDSVGKILTQFSIHTLLCEQDFGLIQSKSSAVASSLSTGWIRVDNTLEHFSLQHTQIPAQNVMTAIATLHFIAQFFAHSEPLLLQHKTLEALINKVNVPGRFEVVSQSPYIILDVAHNEDSAKYLLWRLQQKQFNQCHILIGMLKDKNIEATIEQLISVNAQWYCVDLPAPRGEKADRLQKALHSLNKKSETFNDVPTALKRCVQECQTGDIILVVGSFILASNFMQALLDYKR
ncbi:dihydrofolate synthase [Glaciecola punicea ACAM 611]|uniref:Dihydrofolate synthase/folylpolyglutamate synthase n=1 Tax=Glaciecola punicea ACAM 611 TaxID=1121923 RepID=H5TAF4_9ALTE|nr:folylpolyglutamate synthase/dihydrofolate synthase family protein [Glaciecola punicea]OFA29752.1 hypothetical protein BAE46_13785 [Glaciecola punicea]GAB55281.1 dihydrofolate synthase [Glaciecola punicea ACAM 611]